MPDKFQILFYKSKFLLVGPLTGSNASLDTFHSVGTYNSAFRAIDDGRRATLIQQVCYVIGIPGKCYNSIIGGILIDTLVVSLDGSVVLVLITRDSPMITGYPSEV